MQVAAEIFSSPLFRTRLRIEGRNKKHKSEIPFYKGFSGENIHIYEKKDSRHIH